MKQKFKTIGSIVAMSTMIVFAASCAKENLSDDAQEHMLVKGVLRHVSVNTAIPATESTDKAYVDANNFVRWADDDKLNINGSKLTAEAIRGTHKDTACFNGDVHALPVGTNEIYWSVYPANLIGEYTTGIPSNIASNGNTVDITFPKTYAYSATQLEQPLSGINVMVARTVVAKNKDLDKISLKNLGSVLKINMKAATGVLPSHNKNVSKVIVSSCDGYLAGTYRVNTSYGLTAVSGQTNTVTVTFSSPIDITNQKTVYVLLPPTLSSQCLNITLVNTAGAQFHLASTTATLVRNKSYTANMTAVDFTTEAYANSLNNTDYYFSVSAENKVVFSPGNLQYNAKTTVGNAANFRFAPNQWDYVGMQCLHGNVYDANGQKSKNESISANYNGWIDLFGWGTSGYNGKNPYMVSTTNSQYGPGLNNLTGNYKDYDWGRYNKIFNPKTGKTDAAGSWRLLTATELEYLLNTRTGKTINGTAKARYTMARIRTDVKPVYGLILFPDNYNGGAAPTGVTWGKINDASASWNTRCTAAGWKTLESHGCVFIPASGWRAGTTVGSVGNNPSADHPYQAYVWTSTYVDADFAHHLLVNKNEVKDAVGPKRSNGYGVRLVKKY